MKDPFKYDFNDLYALTKEQGDKRFGSECKHIHTKNGYCQDCQRKVVDRSVLKRGSRR